MNDEELKPFADEWLACWTGNQPEKLLNFYTDDAFYLDPANLEGIKGKDSLATYFGKLLKRNPDWVWSAVEVIPTQKGFTLKWQADIPLHNKTLTIHGLDIVELEKGKISRNEVFFDRHEWLKQMWEN